MGEVQCCQGRCTYQWRRDRLGWCGCPCDDCIRRMIRSAFLAGLFIDPREEVLAHDREQRLK